MHNWHFSPTRGTIPKTHRSPERLRAIQELSTQCFHQRRHDGLLSAGGEINKYATSLFWEKGIKAVTSPYSNMTTTIKNIKYDETTQNQFVFIE